ncbi:MAG TPA: HNH endonuclease [bacterium]|nr:MAG: HNH endonuclease [Thermoprotei archaeon]HDO71302.1 HNH endonuclease [bacterium]HEX68310.1 HNH endonuclease [bacterium]
MGKLEEKVLVLNRYWQVVNVSTVRRALCLLFVGSAQAVWVDKGNFQTFNFEEWVKFSLEHSDGEERIGTVKWKLLIPRIIILSHYDGFPSLSIKLTKKNVYKRDNYTCQYCGKRYPPEYLNIDHVIPRHRGGKTTWDNVVCSCIWCNLKKGGKTLEEAGMKLLKEPRPPFRLPFQKDDVIKEAHPSWKYFIDFTHWKVMVGEEDALI